jgi:hypothetical protein
MLLRHRRNAEILRWELLASERLHCLRMTRDKFVGSSSGHTKTLYPIYLDANLGHRSLGLYTVVRLRCQLKSPAVSQRTREGWGTRFCGEGVGHPPPTNSPSG